MAEESKLKKLKENYEKIKAKFDLPDFDSLSREFSIEKAAEIETDYLIREIRRFIVDKLYNYLRFVETLMNPSNAPMYVFSIIKAFDEDDKKKVNDIYKKLVSHELSFIKLEFRFSEEAEAEMIKSSVKLWDEIKVQLDELITKAEKKMDEKKENNGGGYFG